MGQWSGRELRLKHKIKRSEEFDLRIRFLIGHFQVDFYTNNYITYRKL